MILKPVDWAFIAAFFVVSLLVGIIVSKRAGKSSSEFFLSGRNMPWWLLGVSMVATTFSTDTPNLVTDIVRQNGVSGNWVWWAFLLTGMLTVFVYAKLWRRSGVMTDIEFYELRYSRKPAAFLRGFRAIYLGVFFNIVIMASVTLAAIKIGGVMLNLSPFQTVAIAAVVTALYSMLGGLRSVIITDFIQFSIAMFGAIMAAKISLQHPLVGGLSHLIAHFSEKKAVLSVLPDFSNMNILIPVFIIPFAVQWWSVWYPGSEPGGGGYLAQRMLAAKNEKNAMGATLLFNIAHYGVRPWPWIIVALCSLVVFPDLESLKKAFPNVTIGHDLAYPAMLTFLPAGLLGLVVASLIAAYMSTISTHLNWGSSYVVNDFYKRFIKPDATEKQMVLVGRISTALLMVGACALAPFLENAKRAFDILLQIGAGTGLIFILRWFWWRINAYSEITGMIVSFLIACYFE
ncbi:MAG: Na+:solute symporter, partial [Candidatus Brocadiia bacterium]